jgi:hypothetical protein
MPPRFAEAERRFAVLRARYQAGELDDAAYDAELQRLVIEDDAGDHWVVGAESGEWYWYDGEQWVHRDPPATEDMAERPSPEVPAPTQDLPPAKPTALARRKWLLIGCGGLMLLLVFSCAVLLAVFSWVQ